MNKQTANTYQLIEPLPQDWQSNAYLITPRGIRVAVNITPEAAANVEKFGCKVEWFNGAQTTKAVA